MKVTVNNSEPQFCASCHPSHTNIVDRKTSCIAMSVFHHHPHASERVEAELKSLNGEPQKTITVEMTEAEFMGVTSIAHSNYTTDLRRALRDQYFGQLDGTQVDDA